MAHVVVVTQDLDVRMVLDVFLHAKGHVVLSVREPQHALPAPEVGRYAAVVIIHAPTSTDAGFDLLRHAATSGGKRLARHSYIILTAAAAATSSERLAKMAGVKAHVLELPFDLEEVAATVEGADDDRPSPAREMPSVHVLLRQPPVDG